MNRPILCVASWIALFAAPVAAQCQFEDDVVTGAGTGGFSGPAEFGTDVCVRGEIAIVGAPQTPGLSHTPLGYSRVYRRQAGGWMQIQQLAPIDALTGTSVDFDGKHLAVGAPGITSGGVSLFEHNGIEWVREQVVSVPGVGFGETVSIQGHWLAVQAPYGSSGSVVYLYRKLPSGIWTLSDSIGGPGGGLAGFFGQGLAIGRGVLFIGSPTLGQVEVHYQQGTQWVPGQILTSFDPMACGFGWELAFHRGTLMVSEQCTDTVRFFEKIGGTWMETDSIGLPTTGSFSTTRIKVDLFDHAAVVGVTEPFEQGRVFLLRRNHAGWSLDTELCMSTPTGSDFTFGNAVSINRSHVVVGHRKYQTDGGAFFYSLSKDFFEAGSTAPPWVPKILSR